MPNNAGSAPRLRGSMMQVCEPPGWFHMRANSADPARQPKVLTSISPSRRPLLLPNIHQLSIPELGTIRAVAPPIVVITSNSTREVHDALRRRCLYHWVDHPDFETESRILSLKAPAVGAQLREQLLAFVHALRRQDLFKQPGIAETIDWANALTQLDVVTLQPDIINNTLGALLKYQDDIARIQGSEAARLLAEIVAEAR